ncbi:hypothetical protein HZA97_01265 [Candidatus Woesearchaeota archaeon]|nr:hypothetical protein [Candidatus Woesearchaeota archaeon]
MNKIKALKPSLKEKKRYLVFEMSSKQKIKAFRNVSKAIQYSYKELFGEIGLGEAGLIVLAEKYQEDNQRGVIKVGRKYLDHLRASLTFIQKIEEIETITQSIGASGSLKRAEAKYLAS